MPPITLHMVLARQIAEDLQRDDLDTCRGSYLLGATTPDIRLLTRQDRYSTHYFDLAGPDHQDSVRGFLAEHGEFLEPASLNDETRAFIAGYISHLVMDEQYITRVYRRFFAQHDALGGTIRANVMDRLLQFDLDRTYGNDPQLKHELSEALACAVENLEVGFIETETLEKWRDLAADVAQRTMDWNRMRVMISNHLRFSGIEEGEALGSFLDSLPQLLDETVSHITNAEIDAFVRHSTEAACAAVEMYLVCG